MYLSKTNVLAMKNFIYSAISIVFLLSCSKKDDSEIRCTGFEPEEATILNPEEYEVLSDFFQGKNESQIILGQESVSIDSSAISSLFGKDTLYSNGSYGRDTSYIGFEADSAVIDAYVKANGSSEYWGEDFNVAVKLITDSEFECLNGWEDYHNKYSTGYYKVSRPGIYGDYALIQYSYSCGSLCGFYYVYNLLKKVNGNWTVIKYTRYALVA